MSRSRKKNKCREATDKEWNKLYFLGYTLEELFDEDKIHDLISLARLRIVGEFYYATELNPRYRSGNGQKPRRGTDNYIIGITHKLGDLAGYVVRSMHCSFVAQHDLPSDLAELAPRYADVLINQAHHDLVVRALQLLRASGDVWYDEALGIWQISQSCVDDFLAQRQAARALKVDQRPYHGRPRNQTRQRGIPEGQSIGGLKFA